MAWVPSNVPPASVAGDISRQGSGKLGAGFAKPRNRTIDKMVDQGPGLGGEVSWRHVLARGCGILTSSILAALFKERLKT
jgi:hypothetical protein